MKRLKSLSIHIELNRQRLQRAMNADDASAIKTAQFQLTTLQAEFYEESRKTLGLQPTDLILIFSDQDPDGSVVTQSEYMRRVRLMSEADLNTHTAVPVDESVAGDLSLIVRRTS